eukprot:596153-Prorocentrum_lima.AAC.1
MNLTPDQDEGMIDMKWVEALGEELEHVRLPSVTHPNGEVCQPLICRTTVMILLEHQHRHCIISPALE